MIGEAFQRRRLRREANILEVAKMIGIAPRMVHRYENDNLNESMNDQKDRLDYLNYQWTQEDQGVH
jgi:transcriptional regulator with XRE-family HTH domain